MNKKQKKQIFFVLLACILTVLMSSTIVLGAIYEFDRTNTSSSASSTGGEGGGSGWIARDGTNIDARSGTRYVIRVPNESGVFEDIGGEWYDYFYLNHLFGSYDVKNDDNEAAGYSERMFAGTHYLPWDRVTDGQGIIGFRGLTEKKKSIFAAKASSTANYTKIVNGVEQARHVLVWIRNSSDMIYTDGFGLNIDDIKLLIDYVEAAADNIIASNNFDELTLLQKRVYTDAQIASIKEAARKVKAQVAEIRAGKMEIEIRAEILLRVRTPIVDVSKLVVRGVDISNRIRYTKEGESNYMYYMTNREALALAKIIGTDISSPMKKHFALLWEDGLWKGESRWNTETKYLQEAATYGSAYWNGWDYVYYGNPYATSVTVKYRIEDGTEEGKKIPGVEDKEETITEATEYLSGDIGEFVDLEDYEYTGLQEILPEEKAKDETKDSITIEPDDEEHEVIFWYKPKTKVNIKFRVEDGTEEGIQLPGVDDIEETIKEAKEYSAEEIDFEEYEYSGLEEKKPTSKPKDKNKTKITIEPDGEEHEVIFWFTPNNAMVTIKAYTINNNFLGELEPVEIKGESKTFYEKDVKLSLALQTYEYVGVKVDNGKRVDGKTEVEITNDGKSHEIIFYYKQKVTIKAHAVSKNTGEVLLEFEKYENQDVPLTKVINYYKWEGYKFSNEYTVDYTTGSYVGQEPENTGSRATVTVNETVSGRPVTQVAVIFYYEAEGTTVVEKYQDEKGNDLIDPITTTFMEESKEFKKIEHQNFVGYIYLGLEVDDGARQDGVDSVVIRGDKKSHEIIYVFTKPLGQTVVNVKFVCGSELIGSYTKTFTEGTETFNQNGVLIYSNLYTYVETEVNGEEPKYLPIVSITADGETHEIIFYYELTKTIPIYVFGVLNGSQIYSDSVIENIPLNKTVSPDSNHRETYSNKYYIEYRTTNNSFVNISNVTYNRTGSNASVSVQSGNPNNYKSIVIVFFHETPPPATGNVTHIYTNPITRVQTVKASYNVYFSEKHQFYNTWASTYINDSTPVVAEGSFERADGEKYKTDGVREQDHYKTTIETDEEGKQVIKREYLYTTYPDYGGWYGTCPGEYTSKLLWESHDDPPGPPYHDEWHYEYWCYLPTDSAITSKRYYALDRGKYYFGLKAASSGYHKVTFYYTDQYVDIHHYLALENANGTITYQQIDFDQKIIPVSSTVYVNRLSDANYALYDVKLNSSSKGAMNSVPVSFINGRKNQTIAFYYKKVPVNTSTTGMPVICDAEISKTDLKVDEKFKITIPNKGMHLEANKTGFSTPLNIGEYNNCSTKSWNEYYAARKMAKFDMDIYYNGKLYPAGDEIVLDTKSNPDNPTVRDTGFKQEFEFIVPVWVEDNKNYNVTVWVEPIWYGKGTGGKADENLHMKNNGGIGHANSTFTINVKGIIYDFTVTNVQGDDMWKSMLKLPTNTVAEEKKASGTNLPIGNETQRTNTNYNYGIPKGSKVFFSVNTKGRTNAGITMIPKFYYLSKDASSLVQVNAYIKDRTGNYVAIDQARNSITTHPYKLTNEYGTEKKEAVSLYGSTIKYDVASSIGTYNKILLSKSFRFPYVAYLQNQITNGKTWLQFSWSRAKYSSLKGEILKSVSHWYGDYLLPANAEIAKVGETPSDTVCAKYKDGYILVMFDIYSTLENGTKYLQYTSDIWKNEKTPGLNTVVKFPRLTKTDNTIKTVDIASLVNGNMGPVIIYQAGRSTTQNYDTTGTH